MRFLDYIARHLKAGYTNSFYLMLDVMKKHGTIYDQMLANEIKLSLNAKGMIM